MQYIIKNIFILIIFFSIGFHEQAKAFNKPSFKKSDTIVVQPYNKIYHEKGVKELLCHNVSRGSMLYQENLKTIERLNASLLSAWVGCTVNDKKIIGCLWYKAQFPLKKYARVHSSYEQNSVIMELLGIKPSHASTEMKQENLFARRKYIAYCITASLLIYSLYRYKKRMRIA